MRRENEATEKVQATRRDKVENVLKFLLGAAAIVGGSQLLVNAGSDLSLIHIYHLLLSLRAAPADSKPFSLQALLHPQ